MVKGSLRGEFPCLWFVEHLGILGILGKELLFDLFNSLSEGSGESEFMNGGVIFSEDFPSQGSKLLLLKGCDRQLQVVLLAGPKVS